MKKSTKAIDKEIYENAMRLLNSGKRVCDVVSELGLNWSTVNRWKKINGRVRKDVYDYDPITIIKTKNDKENYSYLLGMYLGNGFIYKCPRTYRFTTYVNKINTNAIDYTLNVFKNFFTTKTNKIEKSTECIEITCHSGKLPLLFPQYSVGKKENRKIELKIWQEDLIDPKMLIKGLIASSGLLFSNSETNEINVKCLHKSSDIIDIFEKYSSLLKFEFKRYTRNNYSVVDILNFNDGEFLKEIENLKSLSVEFNKLSICSDNFNERIFEIIDTKEKAYWLGFLYADGNVSTDQNRIGFHLAYKDIILLERFCDFVGGDRNKIVSYNKNETVFYYISSYNMKNDLIKHNILPDKTHKKEFPIIDDYELFLAFFLGVYDGDGSEGKSQLTSGNKEFLEHCCKRLDVDISKIKFLKNPYGSAYTLFIGKDKYIEVLTNYSYSLERKRITTSQYFPSDDSIKFDKNIISLGACEDCGKPISKKSTRCKKCSSIFLRKPKRTYNISKEELEKLVLEKPMTEIGRMFGVSDSSVRKRCRTLGIDLKELLAKKQTLQNSFKNE